jgi:hypothetical protein
MKQGGQNVFQNNNQNIDVQKQKQNAFMMAPPKITKNSQIA